MISMIAIGDSGGAAKYHDAAFTQESNLQGADNYYVNEQAKAVWQGKGAKLLGLNGAPVTREDFVRLLEGQVTNQKTGEIQDLRENSRGEKRRMGYDLTIAPPKSVSIAALVGRDERVMVAHQRANASAMAWLERHASVIRVREGGKVRSVLAGNLTYATVQHVTNRDNEPHIHSHNVVISAVFDENADKWRSLTNDQLMRLRKSADVIYKSELALELKAHGYELQYKSNGVDFELAGFSQEQIDAFAGRRGKILEALLQHGQEPGDASYEARRAATLDTRSAKHDLPRVELEAAWGAIAQDVGLDARQVVDRAVLRDAAARPQVSALAGQVASSGAGLKPSNLDQDRDNAMRSVSWAIEHLAEREQSFSRPELEVEAVRFGLVAIDSVEMAVDMHIKNNHLVDRGIDEKTGATIFTTLRAVNQERALKGFLDENKGRNNVVLRDEKLFNQLLSDFETQKSADLGGVFKLTNEQVNAAKNVLMHKDGYQGVQGDAGTGKTAMVEFVRTVAEKQGWRVVGVATSSNAAEELGRSTGIASQTVAGLLSSRDNALRVARSELALLKNELSKQGASNPSSGKGVEIERLNVRSKNVNFGRGFYVFDHERGTVFKAEPGLKSAIGSFLMQSSSRKQEAGAGPSQPRRLANAVNLVGRSMASFEEVGLVESLSARDALYLKRDVVLTDLERKYQVKKSELNNLERTGNVFGDKTLLVMDEASLTGVADTVRIGGLAKSLSARVFFQGDIKQHGSIAAGRAFEQAQKLGLHVSSLKETRRFDNAAPEVKAALVDLEHGRFKEALQRINTMSVDELDVADRTAGVYVDNFKRLQAAGVATPKIGIITLTNSDRQAVNQAVSERLAENGLVGALSVTKPHLDIRKLTQAERHHSTTMAGGKVDRLIFSKNYPRLGVRDGDVLKVKAYDYSANRVLCTKDGVDVSVDLHVHRGFLPAQEQKREFHQGDLVETRAKLRFSDTSRPAIANGRRGVLDKIDNEKTTVRWDNGEVSVLNNKMMAFVDHAYAHTSHKEQGASNDMEIGAFGETATGLFNRVATLITLTRSKGDVVIVTSDRAEMLENAGREVTKTVAVDWNRELASIYSAARQGQQGSKTPAKNIALRNEKVRAPAPVQGRDTGLSL